MKARRSSGNSAPGAKGGLELTDLGSGGRLRGRLKGRAWELGHYTLFSVASDPALEFDVVIEVPQGSRNKYEMDHETGVFFLDRELFTATHYPVDYGFVAGTMAEDGDPLDALAVLGAPTFPGCHVHCRAVGLFRMRDEAGMDLKILSVPSRDPRVAWRDLDDVPGHILLEIRHFFDIYKDLEPGKHTEVVGWEHRDAAEEAILKARIRRG